MRFKKALSCLMSAAMMVAFAPNIALAQEDTSNALAASEAASLEETLAANDYVQGQAIVVVDTSVTDALAGAAHSLSTGTDLLAGAENVMDVSAADFTEAMGQRQTTDVQVKCVTSKTLSTEELITELLQDPRVISAEPNVTADVATLDGDSSDATANAVAALSTTNTSATAVEALSTEKATNITGTDSMPDLTEYQWFTGADSGTMSQPEAKEGTSLDVTTWNTEDNASGTVVAVMDSGVNYKHPDLASSMVDMTQYKAGTAYEKGSGTYGYNAVGWDDEECCDPMDDDGHGTHVAGIMCSSWDGKGTSGIAGGASIVAVKIAVNGDISFLAAIKGYAYLSAMMDQGLNLVSVNGSWAGSLTSPGITLAITVLGKKGAVTCVASGNEQTDISKAAYSTSVLSSSPYAIVVNSSDVTGASSDFTNYGQGVTDVYGTGSSILSTYMTSYLPYADPEPSYYEPFTQDTGAAGIIVRKTTANANPFGSGAVVSTYSTDASFDASTGSLAIKLDTSKSTQYFEVLIPVSTEQLASSAYLGFTACGRTTMLHVDSCVGVATSKGKTSYSDSSSTGYVNTWMGFSVPLGDIAEYASDDLGIAWKDGYISMKLEISAESAAIMAAGSGVLYLDCVGLGSNVCDYQIEHGTSMATPSITASAAIIARQLQSEGTSGEQLAQQVVRTIKGSVVQSSAMRTTCTSGGRFTFSALGASTPVIESCTQSGYSLVIEGTGFGSAAGSVHVGYYTAGIKEWTDGRIVVDIPAGASIGKHVVRVFNANGQTGSAVAALSTRTPTLYETSVSLPSGTGGPAGTSFSCMAALGGKIYVLCSTDSGDSVTYKQLWSYTVSTKKWKKLTSLPYSQAAKASMVAYNGKLIVNCGGVMSRGSLIKNNGLYSYHPSTNKWYKLSGKKIPYASTLVVFGGKLLCCGGQVADKYGSLEETKRIYQVNASKGTLKAVGALGTSLSNVQASAYGKTLYVSNGLNNEITNPTIESPRVYGFRWKSGKLVRYSMTSALPKAAKGYMNSYGAVATPSGLVISGYPAAASSGAKSAYDTYVLTLSAKGKASCKRLTKSFSYNTALQLTSTYYKGRVYTLGVAYNEATPVIMRATKLQ